MFVIKSISTANIFHVLIIIYPLHRPPPRHRHHHRHHLTADRGQGHREGRAAVAALFRYVLAADDARPPSRRSHAGSKVKVKPNLRNTIPVLTNTI